MLANFLNAANTLAATLLGQAAGPVTNAATAGGPAGKSVWEYAVMGGPMMIPIGLCSLVALTIAAERLVSLRRGKIIPRRFLHEVEKNLEGADADRSKALVL